MGIEKIMRGATRICDFSNVAGVISSFTDQTNLKSIKRHVPPQTCKLLKMTLIVRILSKSEYLRFFFSL